MRIVHVIHTFPPYSRAGSENYAQALATQQTEDHEVAVFHRIDEPERPEYELTEAQMGALSIFRINRTFRDWRGFEDSYKNDSVAEAFGAFLDRYQPDIVHFHHVTCLSTTCVHEAVRRRLPVVYTLHDFWLLCPRGQLVRRDLSLCKSNSNADCVRCMAHQLPVSHRHQQSEAAPSRGKERKSFPARLRRWLSSRSFAFERGAIRQIQKRTDHMLDMLDLVDRFVAPSRFLRDRYIDFGIRPERIVYSDYGFELSSWKDSPVVAEAPEKLRFAYLGTWIPTKGVDVLLEAFRGVDPNAAVLDIHGYAPPYDGVEDYEQHLRRLAEAPHIHLGGAYEVESVPSLLARADVLVVPSIWYENSPLTIHEGFMAGIPVIASNHGGMKELVKHNVNGLTFRPGSAASLRRAINRLIGDRALLTRLRRGIPAVKDIGDDAKWTEAMYREVRASVSV